MSPAAAIAIFGFKSLSESITGAVKSATEAVSKAAAAQKPAAAAAESTVEKAWTQVKSSFKSAVAEHATRTAQAKAQ